MRVSTIPATLRRAAWTVHRFDWLLLLLAAPALLFPSPLRSLALLVIIAIWAANWIATGAIVPRTPLDWPILLILVMVLVSLGATYSLAVSLAKITGIVLGMAAYYLLARRLATAGAFAWGLWAYAALGAAFAVAGLLGTDWLYKFPLLDRVVSGLPGLIRGLPGIEEGLQPNYVAGALVLFLPVQLALLAGLPPRRSTLGRAALLAALAALTALTLVLTQSRGGLIGLAVGLGTWLAWHGPRTRWLLLAGAMTTALAVILIGSERTASTLLSAIGPNSTGNLQGRVELWSRAVTAIQAFPLTGLGLNGFRHALPVLFPMFTIAPDFDVSHAHNQFLQAALDLGLPGLAAFAALAVGALALLAAALVAQLTFGLADAIAFGARVHLFFWAALAYSVCLYALTQAEPSGAPAPAP